MVEEYDGDAARIWTECGHGHELLARIMALPGFGRQKAQILVALLAKQVEVRPLGWEQVAGDYALDGYRSVADVVDSASLQKVREHKKADEGGRPRRLTPSEGPGECSMLTGCVAQ